MPFIPGKVREAFGEQSIPKIAFLISQELGEPVSVQSVSNWENGAVMPSEHYFKAICRLTKRGPNFFLGWVSDENTHRHPAAGNRR